MKKDEEDFFIDEPPLVEAKNILRSRTFWINVIAFIGFIIQNKYGFIFDENMQTMLLTIINIIMRTITSEPIAWRNRIE